MFFRRRGKKYDHPLPSSKITNLLLKSRTFIKQYKMKIKLKLKQLTLFFIFYVLIVPSLHSIPVNNLSVTRMNDTKIEQTIPSRKALEKQLGRKLKLKERLLFWSLKRSLKKQPNILQFLVPVKIKSMDNRIITGRVLKIEDDHIYLVSSEIDRIDPENPPEEVIIIPLSNIDTISKRPGSIVIGIVLALLFGELGFAFVRLSRESTSDDLRHQGMFLYILAALTLLITVIRRFPKKLRVKGDPANLKPGKLKKFLPSKVEEWPMD